MSFGTKLQHLLVVSVVSVVLISGCRTDTPLVATPTDATAMEFDRLYTAWHRECEAILFSSRTTDYIELPSYRKIVAIGEPALPLLEQRMAEDKGLDFMLAYAAVEISGWDRNEFKGGSEQAFRDRVLRKLRQK